MKRIRIWISSLKLQNKIIATILPLFIVLCIILCTFSTLYFITQNNEDVESSAASWLEVSFSTLNQRWGEIQRTLLQETTTAEFSRTVNDITKKEQDEAQIRGRLQKMFDQFATSCSLIDTVYVLSPGYPPLTDYQTLKTENSSSLLSFDALSSIHEITLFASEPSPFQARKEVIPLIIPISYFSGNSVLMAGSGNESAIMIVIFLSYQRIAEELNQNASSYFSSHSFLSLDGTPLSHNDDRYMEKPYRVHTGKQKILNADITLAIDTLSYQARTRTFIAFSVLAGTMIILIGIIAISAIARFLTRPFSVLMRMVNQIRENIYQGDAHPLYADETGTLITAINEMHQTIKDQIAEIKYTEREKYRYLEQMLTEQINPHFIYNTLEAINLDIMSKNNEEATAMIQDFALFLRKTLNKGQDTTTLEDECTQVFAYVRIMNHRANSKIHFSCALSPGLEDFQIPKLILQPLVENSIKHGFSEMQDAQVFIPEIHIAITRSGNQVALTIIDNGKGFDRERITTCIESDRGKNHVGLANTKMRLSLYFGSSQFNFDSIPYFRNSITITIPDKGQANNQ